jgi:hypothetical protein
MAKNATLAGELLSAEPGVLLELPAREANESLISQKS